MIESKALDAIEPAREAIEIGRSHGWHYADHVQDQGGDFWKTPEIPLQFSSVGNSYLDGHRDGVYDWLSEGQDWYIFEEGDWNASEEEANWHTSDDDYLEDECHD